LTRTPVTPGSRELLPLTARCELQRGCIHHNRATSATGNPTTVQRPGRCLLPVLSDQRSRIKIRDYPRSRPDLDGSASQNILFWSASIGHPARSPLIRPATRRFHVRPGSKHLPGLNQCAHLSDTKLSRPGGLHCPFIRRRRDFARGAHLSFFLAGMKIEC